MDGMSGFTLFVFALLVFVAVTVWKGVRIVSRRGVGRRAAR